MTRLATAFDPTLTDPLEQLRITMRTFLLYSAERPELNGLMNIEGRQDTERLAYVYDTYIGPSLAPVDRLLKSPRQIHVTRRGRSSAANPMRLMQRARRGRARFRALPRKPYFLIFVIFEPWMPIPAIPVAQVRRRSCSRHGLMVASLPRPF